MQRAYKEGEKKWTWRCSLHTGGAEVSMSSRTLQLRATAEEVAVFDNLKNAKTPRPTVEGYTELSQYVGQAVAKVLQGQATSKDALDEAASKSTDALS